MSPPPPVCPGSIIRGPTLPEPVEVLALDPFGDDVRIIGRGLQTGLTHDAVLTAEQLARLTVSVGPQPFDGDARLFRLGVEAHRLGLAYEYDPFFSLSIARVDPLPHQLEAVYGYFLRLPRIRFLLADDPGAGKTIMAGLLLKELKARGLIRFVAQNTREGRVLQKLLDRLREIRRELGTDQVFDVVGEVFPGVLLEKLLRDMYARLTDEHKIQDRIVRDVNPERFRAITESTLEGLAKKELNLSAMSENEYRTAQRLKGDYWLYAVFDCGRTPALHAVQDPARLGWKPVMAVEHYRLDASEVVHGGQA